MTLVACGASEPPPISSIPQQPLPPEPQQPSTATPPDLGLIPLPTVEEVQRSAPVGRPDPFQLLTAELADGDGGGVVDTASGLTLTGVMRVGAQRRALVKTQQSSGALCIGGDGRCVADAEQVLPPGWSVLSIDVDRGCLGLARDGEAQAPICLS